MAMTFCVPVEKEKKPFSSLQFQAFEEELSRRRRDLDSIRQQGQSLTDRGAGIIVEPEISRLRQRWNDINSQVSAIQYPPAITLDARANDNQITRTTYTVVQSSTTRAGSPKSSSQMIVDIRRLSDKVADINRQLTGSELGGKEFDEFTKQEDILKVCLNKYLSLKVPSKICSRRHSIFFFFFIFQRK